MLSEVVSTMNSVVSGGERYLEATKVGFELEQSYRAYRNQAPELPPMEQRKLLAQTHYKGAQKLTKLFHDNGAIWVKFGQFLSSRSDILPMQSKIKHVAHFTGIITSKRSNPHSSWAQIDSLRS